jgi:hypothetical protein
MVLLLCLGVGVALIHANLSPRCHAVFQTCNGDEYYWSVGWPTIYGDAGGCRLPAICWPHELQNIQARRLLVDVFVAAVLVVSPAVVFRLRRGGSLGGGQFSLSDLFVLTTAVAVLCALRSLERVSEWSNWGYEPSLLLYTRLSACPWYDQIAISIAIICALYVAIAAVSQTVRLVATRLFRRTSK